MLLVQFRHLLQLCRNVIGVCQVCFLEALLQLTNGSGAGRTLGIGDGKPHILAFSKGLIDPFQQLEAVLGELRCEVHPPPLCLLYLHRTKWPLEPFSGGVVQDIQPPCHIHVYNVFAPKWLEVTWGVGVGVWDKIFV